MTEKGVFRNSLKGFALKAGIPRSGVLNLVLPPVEEIDTEKEYNRLLLEVLMRA